MRKTQDGWRPTELPYTDIQHPGAGRPRAIDYYHEVDRVGVELELGNQTVSSHDLLKLETAWRTNRISLGVILTVTASGKNILGWSGAEKNFYLTYENAAIVLRIFTPALTVPLVILGFDA